MTAITIHRATLDDLDTLVPLFDGYRTFHSQAPDTDVSRTFPDARLRRNESVIFLARLDGAAAGFTRLYPFFSSVRAAGWQLFGDTLRLRLPLAQA